MNFKNLSLWSAAAGIALLVGCNIYNPDATSGADSCPSGDVDCLLSLGQTLIHDKNFVASMDAYGQAIALDSTRSEGYYGYAKAAIFYYKMNTSSILKDLQKTGEGDMNAFMQHSDADLTDRIQMCMQVIKVMDILTDRDTLTQWYNYKNQDSARAAKTRARDPHFDERVAFITSYLLTAPASRTADKFPLSDRHITFSNLVVEFTAYKMMFKILDFNDLKPKGVFDASDQKMKNLLKDDGSFGDLGDLAESMREDTVFQQEMNDKILELQNGLGDIQQLLSYFAPETQADSSDSTIGGGVEAQSKTNIDSVITSLGGSLVFYQFGDRLDNDADGCIDEELIDSVDNDLDGFVDEDARLINGVGSQSSPGDLVNNDRQGLTDDAQENKVGGLIPNNPRNYILTFVAAYLQSHGELNTEEKNTTWVQPAAHKDGLNIDTRIRIQSDSLAVRLTPGQPVPSQYQAKLDSAKTFVGGCWRKY